MGFPFAHMAKTPQPLPAVAHAGEWGQKWQEGADSEDLAGLSKASGCHGLSSPTLKDRAYLRLLEEEQEFLREGVKTRSFCAVYLFLSEAHCQQQQWG